MAWPLNLPPVTADEGLTGITWPVTLSARLGRTAGPPYSMGDRYDGTDHQAFDPNRDDRHFKRDSICGLLGRLGASRVLGRLRGLVQRVTLPVVSPWARRRQAIANHRFFSALLVDHVCSLLLRPRFFGDRLSEV